MFLSEQLIYIQMQKTGCTHIETLLSKLVDGKSQGKHVAAPDNEIDSGKLIISSIRNPFDWYVSLWTYGCSARGALRNRLVKRYPRFKSIIRDPLASIKTIYQDRKKDLDQWREVYPGTTEDATLFRKWLMLIHDPANRYFLGEGYGESPLSSAYGYMTHRYIYLCCRNLDSLRQVDSYLDLAEFDRHSCYIDYFIRQERLEEDLCKALGQIRMVSDSDRRIIYNGGVTNSSKRSLSPAAYYDDVSIELVTSRDRLLVEKFGYTQPSGL